MQPESLELSHPDGPPLPSGRESFVPPLRSAGQQRDRLLRQIVTDPVTEERTGIRLRGDVGSEEGAAVGGVVPPYVHVSGVDGCTAVPSREILWISNGPIRGRRGETPP